MGRLRLVRDDSWMAEQTLFLSATPSFAVSDVARTVDFFVRVADVELLHVDDGGALLRRGGVTLALWLADGSARGAEPELAGSVSCAMEVAGVDALYAHCQDLGCVHPNGALKVTHWGTREFAVLDPDGNLVTFWERQVPEAPPIG